jgi:DNA-binding NarL/FixJ family response regulator
MSEVAIMGKNLLSRDGLCAIVNKCEDLELIWEAKNYAEMMDFCQRFPPEILILAVDKVDASLIDAIYLISQHQHSKILLVASQYDEIQINDLIRPGVHGHILKTETTESMILAIRTVAHGAYWFSQPGINRLRNTPKSQFNETCEDKGCFTNREKQILPNRGRYSTPCQTGKLDLSQQTVNTVKKRNYNQVNPEITLVGRHMCKKLLPIGCWASIVGTARQKLW